MNNATTAPAATETHNGLALGDIVTCNGYCMRVTELCDWDASLVECGNGSGRVCVGAKSVRKLNAQERAAYSLGDRIA